MGTKAITPPVEQVFNVWTTAMDKVVGAGHYSMDSSITVAKAPYARLFMMGATTGDRDMEVYENSQRLAFQAESFADGMNALAKVYKIDQASHEAMIRMGFRRTFGPQIVSNAEEKIKRVVSRYSLVYTGYLLGKE